MSEPPPTDRRSARQHLSASSANHPIDGVRRSQFAIFAFVFMMYVLNSADRAALAIALPALSVEFRLSPVELGWISSSFLWSYFLLNIPAGIAVDVKGPRTVGTVAVGLWSSAMVLGGAAQTVVQFVLSRMLLGVGESPTFSLGSRIVRERAPQRQRATINTILLAGMHIGVGLGTVGGAYLIMLFGWRVEFIVLGAAGLVWSAAWFFVYPKSGGDAGGRTPTRIINRAELGALFLSPSFLAILATLCLGNFGNFLLSSWMPVYILKELHVSLIGAGILSAVAYCSGAFTAVLFARSAESLVFRKSSRPTDRRFVIAAFLLGGAASLASLPHLTGLWPVVALATTVACMGAASGTNLALLADLLKEDDMIGSVMGIMLTISNLIGTLAPVMTGYILAATGSFDAAWYIGAGGLVTAAFLSLLLIRGYISMEGRRAEPDITAERPPHAASRH